MDRNKTITILSRFMKLPKNCEIYEKYIYTKSEGNVDTYNWITYQITGLFLQGANYKTLITPVKEGKIGWDAEQYDSKKQEIEEHDSYIVHPFEVVEGVSECPKCSSKKTWNIQKQTRSGDEPMTTFSKCTLCKFEWRYSG